MIDLNRKFEEQLQREHTVVSDFFDNSKTCEMLFRRTNRGTNPQGKLHCYFKQTEPLGIGSVIVMKGQPYVIISDKDFDESNAVYSAIAQKTNVTINGVPFVVDTATYGEAQGSIFTQVDGDVIIYTGFNTITSKIKVNDYISAFGNAYQVSNKFVKENIIYIHLKQTTAIPDNYKITYNGATSFDIKESTTYQLSYTVTNNGNIVENPAITYSSSDETIATVDSNGLMTMLKEGTVNITARYNTVSDTTTMTITDTSVPSVDYTMNIVASSYSIRVGGSYKSLTVKYYNSEGTEITSDVIVNKTREDYVWSAWCEGVDLTNDTSFVTWYNHGDVNTNKIKLASNWSYVEKTLTVKCVTDGYTISKDFNITGAYG